MIRIMIMMFGGIEFVERNTLTLIFHDVIFFSNLFVHATTLQHQNLKK